MYEYETSVLRSLCASLSLMSYAASIILVLQVHVTGHSTDHESWLPLICFQFYGLVLNWGFQGVLTTQVCKWICMMQGGLPF